ncbi:MAG: hypothetical protein LBP92_02640 [Deltaproteobacteria bacterium]|nr:hypothetical protein [Deltaproteobacteria bacterium]
MKFKALLICLGIILLAATGLQADPLSGARKMQEHFIKQFGFTPGWYVQCRGRTTQGCQVAKEAVLSDPEGHRETLFIFGSDGRLCRDFHLWRTVARRVNARFHP